MKTVKEISKLTGVRVRALHHYDAIGLLMPTQVTDSGYRLYDEVALDRRSIFTLAHPRSSKVLQKAMQAAAT